MAHENRKDSGFGGRGFRGDERRGRGGRGSRFGNSERDRSPLRDGRFRDRYADSYHGGGGPRRNYSEAGDFGPRESYYPEPYRRGPYPDPWIGDDQYRRDPYADPYRDHYSSRTPALPPVIECDIFVTDSQLRIYGETVERKIKEHNVLTAVSILPDTRTPSQLVEELTAQGGLFAIFINPQNEIHRSLTLNILHGTPQAGKTYNITRCPST